MRFNKTFLHITENGKRIVTRAFPRTTKTIKRVKRMINYSFFYTWFNSYLSTNFCYIILNKNKDLLYPLVFYKHEGELTSEKGIYPLLITYGKESITATPSLEAKKNNFIHFNDLTFAFTKVGLKQIMILHEYKEIKLLLGNSADWENVKEFLLQN